MSINGFKINNVVYKYDYNDLDNKPAIHNVPAGGSANQVLAKNSGTDYDLKWVNSGGGGGGSTEVEIVTYNSTSSADIETAYQAGLIVLCIYNSRVYELTYRESSTKHHFTSLSAGTQYSLTCNNGSWSNSSTTFATGTIPSAYTSTPQPLGTASAGSSTAWARGDHVHAKPTAADIGAIAAPGSPSSGNILSYNGSAWEASAPASVPAAATAAPSDLAASAAVGSSSKYAKEDHVHKKPSYSASDVGAEPAITEVTVSTAGSVSQALDPGKLYHFTGALTALTITLNAAATGQLAHYHFDFNCGSTAPTVTIPNTVTMPSGNSFDASKHYEVDILNNYGVVQSWATS